jgi:hypothetical protein
VSLVRYIVSDEGIREHESLDSRCRHKTPAEAARQARLSADRRAGHSVRQSFHRQKPRVASGLASESYMAGYRDALLDECCATADQATHVKYGVRDAKIGSAADRRTLSPFCS